MWQNAAKKNPDPKRRLLGPMSSKKHILSDDETEFFQIKYGKRWKEVLEQDLNRRGLGPESLQRFDLIFDVMKLGNKTAFDPAWRGKVSKSLAEEVIGMCSPRLASHDSGLLGRFHSCMTT